ncbi:MAG: hypothetical protein CYPHOPRED_001832 [Cyphobasidiales sp. Tagirdzhanova-0007]|nr:MAG: hypothetical protein CYPHOPRED_001832 [Cyphobasidiales sp. Tagirdzhanova-0007]
MSSYADPGTKTQTEIVDLSGTSLGLEECRRAEWQHQGLCWVAELTANGEASDASSSLEKGRLDDKQGGNEDWDRFLQLTGESEYKARIEEWAAVTSKTSQEIGLDTSVYLTTSILVADPAHHRKGIGHALDQATRDAAKKAGRQLHVVRGYTVISDPSHPPHQTEEGQYGHNDCYKYGDSKTTNCQTLTINSLEDFCLYAPPYSKTIGESEQYEVAYCTKAGHGARLMPKGTLTGVHFVQTRDYVQITGTGDFTKIHVPRGDEGGELDPHGASGNGNPIGALVVGGDAAGNKIQFKEWTQFISDDTFCIRACYPGSEDAELCNHIYDTLGCYWNMPANYDSGAFETCHADDDLPMGVYKQEDGSYSTFYQGQPSTPAAHPAAKSSQCSSINTIPAAAYPTTSRNRARRYNGDWEKLQRD